MYSNDFSNTTEFTANALTNGNNSPDTPIITEPDVVGKTVETSDLHMETAPFSDPDPEDSHLYTDWEIWDVTANQLIWVAPNIAGVERVHIHLGDGTFVNSHADRLELFANTDYLLRVRFSDISGALSSWAERSFRTASVTEVLPIQLNDILNTPSPQWIDIYSNNTIVLPAADNPPVMRIDSLTGEQVLEFGGLDGISNRVLNRSAPMDF